MTKKKTRKVVRNTTSGRFTKKENAKTDPVGTVTNTYKIEDKEPENGKDDSTDT